ncbi:MAG: DUF1003 domain-containing protein [Erysipelotrichaceae bacterium]
MKTKMEIEEIVKIIMEEDAIDLETSDEVIDLILAHKVARDTAKQSKTERTFGETLSDTIASAAGSWPFIIVFLLLLFSWIVLNGVILRQAYDPYPFILLNLILSCVAALQAPIIMMSQNRQEKKDRLRAENDYRVNLKSELIVEDLHKKIDHMIENQKAILQKIHCLEQDKKNPNQEG